MDGVERGHLIAVIAVFIGKGTFILQSNELLIPWYDNMRLKPKKGVVFCVGKTSNKMSKSAVSRCWRHPNLCVRISWEVSETDASSSKRHEW